VFKSAELDAMLARVQRSQDLVVKTNYAIAARSHSGPASAWALHPEADEFWFVRRGAAKLTLGNYSFMMGVLGSGTQQFTANAGDVVSVPRNKAYQLDAPGGRFDYIAVRVFPAQRHLQAGATPPTPRPMPTIAEKSKIENILAESNQNVMLHSAGAVLINQVVYDRAPGPWEVHMACDDLYFWRLGTGKAQIDGTLVHAKEEQPGEFRGFGVTGSRDYTVGPGDFVLIPRNTVHHMDGGDAKLGYVLVKICD